MATLSPQLTQPRLVTSSAAEASIPAPVPVSVPAPIQLARPEKFYGDTGDCWPFLVQCEMHFELQTQQFSTEQAKVAYIISLLTGRAEAWVMAEWSKNAGICDSFSAFLGDSYIARQPSP